MLVLLLKQHEVAPESSFQQRLYRIQAIRSRGLIYLYKDFFGRNTISLKKKSQQF